MREKFTKNQVKEKELIILTSIFFFLLFAYLSGEFAWMKDFQLLVDLFAGIFAFFIGILSLVRFYTKRNYVNYLLLGLGFLTVSLLEVFQLLLSLQAFSDFFTMPSSEVFPSTVVLSRVFLSFVFFLSWIMTKEEYMVRAVKEKLAFVAILFAISTFVIVVSTFSNLFVGLEAYAFAIVMQTLALMFYLLTLIGYTRSRGMYFRNFDFWIIFSLTFSILSQIFFLPYLNLEYELMLNLSTLAKFISYTILLIGFLSSIYEMYKSEEKAQLELKRKNLLLTLTKRKVEEAYMILRQEKWELTKGKSKRKTDKIFKDILRN
ncbi:MAG: PAS/PAC and GAF sensor-containing diguanylate cyclase/phosphodiesterase [candidate division WS6 bacterium GW2011_GWE2_33_157]|uniref:Sensory box histidine kinase n=1 Tax=candidate division WS6 bacterium GW2011_GWB1_33_6 TaxID=1619088 RepID=A0A0G0AVF6_9BACT|nr:MAG: PAS/PAC and GAF sensor-containing diguanylate cyclase/phosphodiesterase [candidate division WS6 bacterium GW2011_GWE2_33_157]KKP45875.1 MAG: PAS/PAC and GAF sensor-containing diguanylate cyclase/phosphodiesterase [candidate division WS6 bacterium GW2011_GWF1_33_233]KKP55128.1 MAG: PAS/PAC and GAF sensor-containing diguanylate cyclase/phosphodiesterase [candidate division WS6 bacterium GW2011_WS6_33_547]KKP55336.1 MAG: Sensory box histidine kinase [candidate division WS6 bacterium GW2011_